MHVSAEDVFQPWIPTGYIEMKREAEIGINKLSISDPVSMKPHRALHDPPYLLKQV